MEEIGDVFPWRKQLKILQRLAVMSILTSTAVVELVRR